MRVARLDATSLNSPALASLMLISFGSSCRSRRAPPIASLCHESQPRRLLAPLFLLHCSLRHRLRSRTTPNYISGTPSLGSEASRGTPRPAVLLRTGNPLQAPSAYPREPQNRRSRAWLGPLRPDRSPHLERVADQPIVSLNAYRLGRSILCFV